MMKTRGRFERFVRSGWLGCLALMAGVLLAGSPLAQEPAPDRSPSEVLAEILEDETARAQLIEELRTTAEQVPAGETASETSFTRSLAMVTQSVAQSALSDITAAFGALAGLMDGTSDFSLPGFLNGLFGLAVVLAVSLFGLGIARQLAGRAFQSISAWIHQGNGAGSLIRQSTAVILAALVDVLAIVAAWVVGYGAMALISGLTEATGTYAALYLNAFLFIELFRVVLRGLFSAREGRLRILPLSDTNAEYWQGRVTRLAGFLGYGLLLVVPVAGESLAPAVGRSLTVIIVLLAFLHVLRVVLRNRQTVSEQLRIASGQARSTVTGFGYNVLARLWHVLVVLYFAALAIVVVARPEDALPVMLSATVQMAIAIAVGILAAALANQFLGHHRFIDKALLARIPSLESRLDGFMPTVVKVLDVAILLVVLGFILDAWGLFRFADWIASDAGTTVISTVITVALILGAAKGLWIVLASYIEYRLNPETGRGEPSAREKTLLTIFRNAIMAAIIILTLMIVLAELGINIGPLIAGAGVLGLAIGFGAQKLVQDIITGIFIQMENAINTGDVVTAGGITGTAEKLTVRSLAIRDLNGTYHIIPFSSVDTVSNFNREFAYHVGVYGVAYREDTDEVIVHLKKAFEELKQDPEQSPNILSDELEVHGVTALADSSVNIRIRIMTLAGTQWATGRAYNRLVKRHLDAAGIEIPFPHMTLYFGADKDGSAPAGPIRLEKPAD